MDSVHYADWGRVDAKQARQVGLQIIDVGQWDGKVVPEREWVVPGWILPRAVTLIAGAGGTGKSLLLQQWLSAIALGDVFMGVRGATPVPTLYVNCEDDVEELHRRQVAIANAFNRRLSSYVGQVHIVARLGMDNPLGVIGDDGKFKPSAFYADIRYAAMQIGAKVIALDNAMQLYVGNLNDPREVTVFCNALSRLALDTGDAVVLAGHVAKAQGSEFAGSMAWENAARMRLLLKREVNEKGEEIEDSDRRILTRGKANSARKGECLSMAWHEGAFYSDRDIKTADGRDAAHEATFLRCLHRATEQRRHVSHMPAANYAPKVFATMSESAGIGKRALEAAMNRLIDAEEIVLNQELWRDGKNRRLAYGIARAKAGQSCANPRANPAQTDAQTVREPCANPAQARAHTRPYPTDIVGGAVGLPASEQDYEIEAGPQPVPEDPGYLALIEAELSLVPDHAADCDEPELPEPWL
jgi:RecA-family ATPase